jgi:hypothetical protein
MEALGSSETLENFYQITRRPIQNIVMSAPVCSVHEYKRCGEMISKPKCTQTAPLSKIMPEITSHCLQSLV